MTAYADLNELVNRASGGNSGLPEFLDMHKEARVAGAVAQTTLAGKYSSLWQYEGSPSHGAVPGAVAVPTNATQGAWGQVNPGGGRQKFATALFGTMSTTGTLYLYDRLLHIGGFDATVITQQNVGGALTRYTNGLGVEMWAEIYTQIGATATTITANYTNDQGTAGRTSQAMPFGGTNNREAQRMIPLSLAAGDKGVQAVAGVTVLATTGTAGNFGVTLMRRLAAFGIGGSGSGTVRNFVDGPMIEYLTNACLAWFYLPSGSAASPTFDMWTFNTER